MSAQDESDSDLIKKPPYERMLHGDDAQKVAEVGRKITAAEAADTQTDLVLAQGVSDFPSRLDRARGRAWWMLERKEKTIRAMRRAVRDGRKFGFGYELARSLLDLAAVDEINRQENLSEGISLLKELESVVPRAEAWLLGDQYDEAVVAPEFDLEAWENEHGPLCLYRTQKNDLPASVLPPPRVSGLRAVSSRSGP